MSRVKTKDLIGPALDWAVAKCEGYTPVIREDNGYGIAVIIANFPGSYSTEWAYGGPIIERAEIQLSSSPYSEGYWCYAVCMGSTLELSGPTPLVAAMRCYVASKLGEEVELPDQLKEV